MRCAVEWCRYPQPEKPGKNFVEARKTALTGWEGGAYIRLTNEGGAPLATKKFASVSALDEIQESRVSDLDLARSRKAEWPT